MQTRQSWYVFGVLVFLACPAKWLATVGVGHSTASKPLLRTWLCQNSLERNFTMANSSSPSKKTLAVVGSGSHIVTGTLIYTVTRSI
jgi:hypothetical protein